MSSEPDGLGAIDPDSSFEQEQKKNLVKSLNLFDLVFFGIATVVSLDVLGEISSFGGQTFTWMLILVPLFVIPYAFLMSEMGGAFAEEGGPYVWMKLAFGRFWSALGAMLYWITNPLWLGGSLCFLSAAAVNENLVSMPEGSLGDWLFKLIFVWIGILVAVISLKRGKWIPSIGAFVKVGVLAIVTITVIIYAIEHGVHGYGIGGFSPTLAGFIAAVPVLVFAISGFEAGTAASEEMRNAQHDVPRYITRSAFVSAFCYLIPILSILLVVPVNQITGVSGFMSAVATTFTVYGSLQGVLVKIAAVLFVFTLLTQGAAWMMGSDRVLAACAMDGGLPRWFGTFSKRFGTPMRVNLMSGAVATAFVIVAQQLNSGSAATTFSIVLTVAISTVLMSYIIIYPACWVLRRRYPEVERPFVVPGGDWGLRISTVFATFFVVLGSWVAVFPGTIEPLVGLEYNFAEEWGVSRGRFEALTLGTLAVIVALTVVGVWWAKLEERREARSAEVPVAGGEAVLPSKRV
ncbi:MAG: APC family permease [Actinobacteria bacterium]|nr:APC family permease [Actinomycetota bacterium]